MITRRRSQPLVLLPLLAGCEFDFTGIGDALAEAWCGPGQCLPTLSASGTVRIGDYYAWGQEASVLVYTDVDTLRPIDSVSVYPGPSRGVYWIGFGASPPAGVCRFMGRAVLWDGRRSELRPLFRGAPSCVASYEGAYPAADFVLPAYTPLPEPFAITGTVSVDGDPPPSGAASVRLTVRTHDNMGPVAVPLDDQGTYRLETNDRAIWFALCHAVRARIEVSATGGALVRETELAATTLGTCVSGRRLPDVRIGERKAATGRVWIRETAQVPYTLVGAAEAQVAILRSTDSTMVGTEVSTQDDGYFHLWFPDGLVDPGCDWLLRATLVGDTTEVRPLLPAGEGPCREGVFHDFWFGPRGY
jgi:hypothetical protein